MVIEEFKQTLEVMTNIIKLELEGYYFQKSPNFHPQTWRNFEKLKTFYENFFSTKKENIESLRKRFETVLCFDETDQIQHKISENELKANTIHCKQCNKVFDKKKIKCDECKTNLRHGTSLNEPISTRIVPQKNEKKVKSTNYVESCNKDKGVGLKSSSVCHTPRNASLEHHLCSIKSTSKSNNVTPNITLLDPVFVNPASKSSLRVVLDKIAVIQDRAISFTFYAMVRP